LGDSPSPKPPASGRCARPFVPAYGFGVSSFPVGRVAIDVSLRLRHGDHKGATRRICQSGTFVQVWT